ncbi:MAG: addiction module protein [Polaromonas sp.]|nr:addiction module protein [Polaromonas sp.]
MNQKNPAFTGFPRALLQTAREQLAFLPAVVLLGPRQVGKTTLARMISASYPGAVSFDLQLASDVDCSLKLGLNSDLYKHPTHMYANINQELEHLSIAEKRSLGEALIVSADSEASAAFVTEAQRVELRRRLAHHRANPAESSVDFSQLKNKLLASTR